MIYVNGSDKVLVPKQTVNKILKYGLKYRVMIGFSHFDIIDNENIWLPVAEEVKS